MNDDRWDGYCAVEASSGGTRHRVRGSRMVDGSSGSTAYRIRGDGRVVDVDTGETRFRVRDDGRVVDVTTGPSGGGARRRISGDPVAAHGPLDQIVRSPSQRLATR